MAQKHEILYVNFYTDGSAARKAAPAFPAAQPKAHAKRHKKPVIYIDPVAVGSIVVAVALLVMMAVGLTQLQNARAEALAMESYVHELTAENEKLTDDFNKDVNLDSVEKTAVALGMVPKDQVKNSTVYVDRVQWDASNTTFWSQVYAFLTNLFA